MVSYQVTQHVLSYLKLLMIGLLHYLIKNTIDSVYFDFAKAFDSVSHAKLLHKLSGYGLAGKLIDFIGEFLFNRVQRVVLPNGASNFRPVLSGVPQGSVLGPLLFLLYINDITDLFNNKTSIKLFADDIKIYLEIIDRSDFEEFQQCINNVALWSNAWQLSLSINKCHFMRVSLSKSIVPHSYSLNNNLLSTVDCCRDLGVEVDSHLSFNRHINSIVAKAHLRASQILRCFLSRDPYVLTKAFKVYVRPILEYCSPVWSPYGIVNINKIESVQRQFTKKLKGMSNKSYAERLSMVDLERLELRRLHADLKLCFNILHGYSTLHFNEFFEYSNTTFTRGHSFKIHVPNSRINVRQSFFCVRVINVWNSLPDNIVSATSPALFNKLLHDINLKQHLLGKN
jgi:hypothetical protein